MSETWEEQFDKEFIYKGNEFNCVLKEDGDAFTGSELKEFIRTVVEQAKEEQREEDAKIAESAYDLLSAKYKHPTEVGLSPVVEAIATAIRNKV